MNRRMLAVPIAALLFAAGSAQGVDKPSRSKVLPEVRVLWLDANGCKPQLSTELQNIGYALATSQKNAEGVLSVQLRSLGPSDETSARYEVRLRDLNGGVVRETSGHGTSSSHDGLCKVVSRQIAEYLETRMERIVRATPGVLTTRTTISPQQDLS